MLDKTMRKEPLGTFEFDKRTEGMTEEGIARHYRERDHWA